MQITNKGGFTMVLTIAYGENIFIGRTCCNKSALQHQLLLSGSTFAEFDNMMILAKKNCCKANYQYLDKKVIRNDTRI